MSNKPLHVVILAAGKGSRMRSDLPKVLHQIAGKSLLGHVIDSALELNPAQIHVVVGHGKDLVIDSFAQHACNDRLNWVEQTEQLGTGHAVSQALPFIVSDAGKDSDSANSSANKSANVLMLTADVPLIRSSTLSAMVSAMSSSPLALLTALVDDPFGLGRITRDESAAVSGIVEQKDANSEQRKINEINSGIICADSEQLKIWLSQVSNDNVQQEFYLTDVVGLAYAAGNPIAALHPDNNAEVTGINSRLQLSQVERLFQAEQAEQLMNNGVTIMDPARIDLRGDIEVGSDSVIDVNVVLQGRVRIGRNVTIAPNCIITDSILADNVTVHSNTVIEGSELGADVNVGPFARLRPGTKLADKVKIGNFVETKNAQLDVGAKVNHLSYVGDATVGSNTNIGAGVITCNYDGANKHKTTIGKDVFVGSNSQLVAPVEIEDGATIGAGSTITTKVEANKLAISRGKQRQIDGWTRPTKAR
ncbi:MAG: bifunctional UDP-N-acetylglucosamine pyrophosphorylase/glucosamine-1-phosphate N-acetyltransferase [Arenicella sp.]|jgi:bifunctional UDP-N-acetylglucosamine pyrophosphorylase/glucosamine-1-phosphate N-acetyltransferase